MICVLSPAKTLDFEGVLPNFDQTMSAAPRLLDESQQLIHALREFTATELADLMSLSDSLATLNTQRYVAWSGEGQRAAIYAFKGDVYKGLSANTLSAQGQDAAQRRLRILSGLYGVLRPFDEIEPHRLEMGTRLHTSRGRQLYAFWGEQITDTLNQDLAHFYECDLDELAQRHAMNQVKIGDTQLTQDSKTPLLLNLASNEYFKSVKSKLLLAQLVTPSFYDESKGKMKVISFYAKRARGLMARFVLENGCQDATSLQAFNIEGYRYVSEGSTLLAPRFERRTADRPSH